ncbi:MULTISPECIES: hypothetical protein [Streptomyces]|uniref:Uncharacterized protein n=2 Tax=Streptomyces TaxID=1883 RepID=A0AA40SJV8_9ACTN|nr:hypothetical protein [Streptomyces calvus]MBA8947633.1 hypothetical protein [Streptomyces calvus]MBA8974005.1 hypothetical protein [Streptomyces calvus]MYS26392.1 hypothetical protein [Streptomyces sp. SID7804]GGP79401.1 hypothetical protein GCM10010247_60930 [Streptomyces calvus]
MSPAVAGPALFIGGDTDYVALVRPELDPADPGVRRAAEQAGVAPEELAGPGDTWAVLYEYGGEGDGFELPGVRDAEPADFAERLRAELAAASGPFTVDGGAVLRLDARPAGTDRYAFTAHLTPPADAGTPLTVETGPLPVAELLADLDTFLGSLA